MRVLMLGWEFPPFISGGLGTACYGLTRALDRLGVEITFVLPKSVDGDYTTHVKLISPQSSRIAAQSSNNGHATAAPPQTQVLDQSGQSILPQDSVGFKLSRQFENVTFKEIPAWMKSPYQTPAWFAERAKQSGKSIEQIANEVAQEIAQQQATQSPESQSQDQPHTPPPTDSAKDYGQDMFMQIQQYADMAVQLSQHETFDVIHAHDWMTYPAGLAIAGLTGKPLVIHVHSTEFDRSGENIDTRIYDVERRGMHGAMKVLCVSHLTRKICEHRYGVPSHKTQVVYNGIEMPDNIPHPPTIKRGDKIVLFLGRITLQKGPEYFIAAAKKVLEKYDKVKFVIAGSGDKTKKIIKMAAEMGIGHKVLFAGFLRGKDVERVFAMADVYVMPSVSEPFGIAPLEAIRHDTPVIISKNSGVAEVLTHALKIDFWDIEEMANKIIAILKHPPLSQTLREHADIDARRLTWDDAARNCFDAYVNVKNEMIKTNNRITGNNSIIPETHV